MHRQSDETICARGSIGEGSAEIQSRDLPHLRAAAVLVQRRGEEGDVKGVRAAGLDNLLRVAAIQGRAPGDGGRDVISSVWFDLDRGG